MTECISLAGVLPHVFAGSEKNEPVCHSGIWLRNIELQRGKRYLISAESGTGKSSLCSFIYGNRDDYSGNILFDGHNIRTFSIAEWCEFRSRSIALLPQEMRLFPELTVLENIQLKNSLTNYRSKKEILSMLDEIDLGDKADTKAALLSIGQQQRAALIRALCQPFDFLLLDEPVSHLDSRNNTITAAIVQREADRQGASIIATSVGYHIAITDYTLIRL